MSNGEPSKPEAAASRVETYSSTTSDWAGTVWVFNSPPDGQIVVAPPQAADDEESRLFGSNLRDAVKAWRR